MKRQLRPRRIVRLVADAYSSATKTLDSDQRARWARPVACRDNARRRIGAQSMHDEGKEPARDAFAHLPLKARGELRDLPCVRDHPTKLAVRVSRALLAIYQRANGTTTREWLA